MTEDISRASFGGHLWDPEPIYRLVRDAVQRDPWLSVPTITPISKAQAVFPHAVTEPDWAAELEVLTVGQAVTTAPAVAPAAIVSSLIISDESAADTDFPLAAMLTDALRRDVVAKASADTINAPAVANAAAPTPIYPQLANVSGETLRAAVLGAYGEIVRNGGMPTDVVVSPELFVAEAGREGTAGPVLNAGAMFADLGLGVHVAPGLKAEQGMVLDRSGAYTLLRRDVSAESTRYSPEAWSRRATELRITARLAVAIPRPSESARSLTVAPA
jgi:hypothetical protein